MFTLITIIILFGCYSTYKINQECKTKKIAFNIYEAKQIYYWGFIFGVSTLIAAIIILSIYYLP